MKNYFIENLINKLFKPKPFIQLSPDRQIKQLRSALLTMLNAFDTQFVVESNELQAIRQANAALKATVK